LDEPKQLSQSFSGSGGLYQAAVPVGGGADLEPVVSEGVVPQDDVVIADHGHEDAVVQV